MITRDRPHFHTGSMRLEMWKGPSMVLRSNAVGPKRVGGLTYQGMAPCIHVACPQGSNMLAELGVRISVMRIVVVPIAPMFMRLVVMEAGATGENPTPHYVTLTVDAPCFALLFKPPVAAAPWTAALTAAAAAGIGLEVTLPTSAPSPPTATEPAATTRGTRAIPPRVVPVLQCRTA